MSGPLGPGDVARFRDLVRERVGLSFPATPGQAERLRGEGAQEYLTKPLDVRRLLEVLRDNLPAAQAVSRGGP